METPDVTASLEKATSLGGRVVTPRTVMPDVTLGVFEDPEGHVIGLVEAKAARERPHGVHVPLVAIVPPREKRKALNARVDAAYARPTGWKPYARLSGRRRPSAFFR